MKRTRTIFLSAVLAIFALAVAVRFAAAQPYGSQSPSPAPSPFAVTIKNFAFSPSELTIPVGATVVWKNEDSVAHTATSSGQGFDSGNLDQGQSFSFTFAKAGTYAYVCSYHPNMTGKIVVQDPSQSSSAR